MVILVQGTIPVRRNQMKLLAVPTRVFRLLLLLTISIANLLEAVKEGISDDLYGSITISMI